ncbi:hypothetical protein C0995_004040, partial [Termitomyces sp. Mi166
YTDDLIDKVTDPDFESTENMTDSNDGNPISGFAFLLVDGPKTQDIDSETIEDNDEKQDLEKDIAHKAVGVMD